MIDPVQEILDRYAGLAIAELTRLARPNGWINQLSRHANNGLIAVTISVASVSIPVVGDCGLDIINLLSRAQTRLTTGRILREVNNWGEATVKRCLSDLIKKGLIRNSRKAPCGYWLPLRFPEWEK